MNNHNLKKNIQNYLKKFLSQRKENFQRLRMKEFWDFFIGERMSAVYTAISLENAAVFLALFFAILFGARLKTLTLDADPHAVCITLAFGFICSILKQIHRLYSNNKFNFKWMNSRK